MHTAIPKAGRHGWLAAGALIVAAVLLGLLLGRATATEQLVRDPVSVGFLRDMQVHHEQAVAMSSSLHRRSGERAVSTLAFDILTTQHGQIGIMSGWLRLSGQLPGTSAAPMAWMGQPHRGPMPGMATPAEVRQLDTLPEPRLTEQFLRQMIRHHRGALPMAAYAADNAGHPAVASLARSMLAGQDAEIRAMQDMLHERGFSPEPETEPAPPGRPAGADHSQHSR